MKKLLLALCLFGLAACRSTSASLHDSSCTGKDCKDCAALKAGDCKSCTGDAADLQKCQADGTCPVTGKKMN